MEFIGWIGSIFLALCGMPQAIKTWTTKSARDISWVFLTMWFFGEALTFLYIVLGDTTQWPLIVNYFLNILLVGYLLIAKHKYGNN